MQRRGWAMADIEQQARELLAEQYRADGQPVLAHAVEHGASSPWADAPLRAIAAALRAPTFTLATVKPPRDRRTKLREDV